MKLRSYQTKLNTPAKNFLFNSDEQKAQVYAPTGAGKTVCFEALIAEAVSKGFTKIAIVHPRIALSTDQLKRYKSGKRTAKVMTTSFHSGAHYNGKIKTDADGKVVAEPREFNTTTVSKLTDTQDAAIADGYDAHITFSSYASFHKIATVNFDLIIFDEAHYIAAQENFRVWNETLTAGKVLYYTATPITTELEGGMFDESKFGSVIASVNPKELIDGGFIVAPLIHEAHAKTTGKGDVDKMGLLAEAYVKQYEEGTKYGMPYWQMLAVMQGVQDDLRLLDAPGAAAELNAKIKAINPNIGWVNVYTVDGAGQTKNGIPAATREGLLVDVKENGGNAIVAHYDTLSEGIDISTLGGALLLRKMSKAKVLQTIGRCARPYVGDLDSKFMPVLENRMKPRCILTLAIVDGEWMGADIEDVVKAFIAAGYDKDGLFTTISDEDKATGTDETEAEIGLDDETGFGASILAYRTQEKLRDLKAVWAERMLAA